MELTKTETAELENIGEGMPLWPGDTLSHDSARSLIEKGLALRYEGEYCLTESGKALALKLFPNLKFGSRTTEFANGGGKTIYKS